LYPFINKKKHILYKMQLSTTSGILLCLAITTVSMRVCPNLGSAANFAVIGASTVSNAGLTLVNGNVAISPGISLTGFNAFGVINGGQALGTTVAKKAQDDVTTAYNYLYKLTPTVRMTGVDLAGKTLGPGVYHFNSAAAISQPAGVLTLSGQGVYIFQVGSTLVTSGNSRIKAINGATAHCIFWQVGSSVTLGDNSKFMGNILAYASVGLAANVVYNGSIYARTGAVTLTNDIIVGGTRCEIC
jgi:hypothetical protein